MNRQKNTAIFNAAFVSLGFVLRDSHADQSTREPTYCSTYSNSSQGRHNWPGGYEWTKSGNGEGANTEQPSQTATYYRAGSGTGCGTFGRLGVFLVSKILCASALGKKY